MADKVGMGGALDAVVDKAKEGLGAALKPQLEKVINETLEKLGPKAGDVAYEKMSDKYSILKSSETAKDKAIEAASNAVMSFKDMVMDFCEDVVAKPKETLKKVGVIMMRACRKAADESVKALMSLTGACAPCMKKFVNLKDIVDQITEMLQTTLKEEVTAGLKSKGAPSMLTDNIEWGNENDDIGEPPSKAKPQQQEMA